MTFRTFRTRQPFETDPGSDATREALRSRPRSRILAGGVLEYRSVGVLRSVRIGPSERGVGGAFSALGPGQNNPGLSPGLLSITASRYRPSHDALLTRSGDNLDRSFASWTHPI
jgi:hypothetical protein